MVVLPAGDLSVLGETDGDVRWVHLGYQSATEDFEMKIQRVNSKWWNYHVSLYVENLLALQSAPRYWMKKSFAQPTGELCVHGTPPSPPPPATTPPAPSFLEGAV